MAETSRPLSAALQQELEDAIWRVAQQRFGILTVRSGGIVRTISELSRRYLARLGEHEGLPAPRTHPRARGVSRIAEADELLARLVFFTVSDLPKVAFPLAELDGCDELPAGPWRVLDVGAGCGSMSLGLVAYLSATGRRCGLELDAVDQDAGALELLELVLTECRGELSDGVECRRHRMDLAQGHPTTPGGYHLILLGSVLNELDPPRTLPLVRSLLGALAPGGHLLIVEPALRRTSRALHHLRDELLAAGEATVFAPCTRGGPCPVLAREGDWCHESRPWTLPARQRQLAAATGLRRRDLKWSYLALNRHGGSLLRHGPGARRVVSDLLAPKGRHEAFLCGEAGRERLELLRRHRAPDNEAFRHLDRGQLIWLEDAGEGTRLAATARVRVLDPAFLSGGER